MVPFTLVLFICNCVYFVFMFSLYRFTKLKMAIEYCAISDNVMTLLVKNFNNVIWPNSITELMKDLRYNLTYATTMATVGMYF